jgi:hypothetical protein
MARRLVRDNKACRLAANNGLALENLAGAGHSPAASHLSDGHLAHSAARTSRHGEGGRTGFQLGLQGRHEYLGINNIVSCTT